MYLYRRYPVLRYVHVLPCGIITPGPYPTSSVQASSGLCFNHRFSGIPN